MIEGKPRLARLAAILTQLQSKPLVTSTDIAEKHGVSIRTVYRDIRTLEQSGIPIITEEGRGYSLIDGYKLPPVMFSEEEANALITAEQIVATDKESSLVEHYQSAITKIKAVLNSNQKLKVDFLASRLQVRNNPEQEKTSHYLIQLQSAIANFQVTDLSYWSLADMHSQRTVEPFALYTTQGNWILIAFCQIKKDFRAFRLDRIQALKVLNKHFEPHKMTLEQYLESCRKEWIDTPDIQLTQG